jgi:hypothetical protein
MEVGMDTKVTKKTIKKTAKSYNEALEKMFGIFPNEYIQEYTSNEFCGVGSPVGKLFKIGYSGHKDVLTKNATEYYLSVATLTEGYGSKPARLKEEESIVTVTAKCFIPFNRYYEEETHRDYEGNTTRRENIKQDGIIIDFEKIYSVTKKEWDKRYQETLSLFDNNEKFKKEYRERIGLVNKCLETWKELMKAELKNTQDELLKFLVK